MIIETLRTTGFRNLASGRIEFSQQVNAFTGLNAQGKTNILEAISVLAEGRSFRGAKMQEMINLDQVECAVEGSVITQDKEVDLKIFMNKGNRKFFVDDVVVSDLRIFLGNFSYVVFSAETMAIIDGDPKARRSFLDHGCFSIDPLYLITLREYRKALKSRNALLKTNPGNPMLISTWDDPLSRFGALIIMARHRYLNLLKEIAAEIHETMANSREKLEIRYLCSRIEISPDEIVTQENIENQLKTLFESELDNDIRRGSTMVGPHRDELRILLNDQDLRYFGSRGQKRTAVLSLKLAELEVFNGERNDYPVLLLDDIASEFDEERQKKLIRAIPDDIQVIISHTDRLVDQFCRPVQYFNVNDGCVLACQD